MSNFVFTVKHSGNISIDDVINIARTMRPRSMARTLAGTCKEILGTDRFHDLETADFLGQNGQCFSEYVCELTADGVKFARSVRKDTILRLGLE